MEAKGESVLPADCKKIIYLDNKFDNRHTLNTRDVFESRHHLLRKIFSKTAYRRRMCYMIKILVLVKFYEFDTKYLKE